MAKVRGDAEWQRRNPRLAGFLTQEEIQAAFDATDRPSQRLRHLSGVVLYGLRQVIWGRVFRTERDMSQDIPRPFPEVVVPYCTPFRGVASRSSTCPTPSRARGSWRGALGG